MSYPPLVSATITSYSWSDKKNAATWPENGDVVRHAVYG
jgi:hypothetical protein